MADEEFAKPKKCPPEGAPEWMTTYGDMVTLLLCFFVILMNPEAIDGHRLDMIMQSFNGLGVLQGGNTLSVGELTELGNNILSMPSQSRGTGLDKARQSAVSMFKPDIKSEKVKITEDERGLIISLAGDMLFRPATAEVNIEESRVILQKLSRLLSNPELSDRNFKVEGHTDEGPTDPDGPFATNWELSAARSANVLHYLVDFGADDSQFQISGFSSNRPVAPNESEEGRAFNRRVDVVILSDGHL